jgi:hypothetical protein
MLALLLIFMLVVSGTGKAAMLLLVALVVCCELYANRSDTVNAVGEIDWPKSTRRE